MHYLNIKKRHIGNPIQIVNCKFIFRPHRLVVRTPDSQSGNTGSNPVGAVFYFEASI